MSRRLLIHFYGDPSPQNAHYQWRRETPAGKPDRETWRYDHDGPCNIQQIFSAQGRSEISEFDITVSSPDHFYHWLQSNDATQLSRLRIFSSATDKDSNTLPDRRTTPGADTTTSEWRRLFELLATDGVVPNLKRLELFWDQDGCFHVGLGKSVDFVRALGKLRPRECVEVAGGYYAVNWPTYLEREMGVPVIVGEHSPDLRRFQSNTKNLWP